MSVVECPNCGAESGQVWRCEDCGRDLAAETTTSGREEA